jgi:hypothetical protein
MGKVGFEHDVVRVIVSKAALKPFRSNQEHAQIRRLKYSQSRMGEKTLSLRRRPVEFVIERFEQKRHPAGAALFRQRLEKPMRILSIPFRKRHFTRRRQVAY